MEGGEKEVVLDMLRQAESGQDPPHKADVGADAFLTLLYFKMMLSLRTHRPSTSVASLFSSLPFFQCA
jgi:hypothetical protein